MIIVSKDLLSEFLLGSNHSVRQFSVFLNRLYELFKEQNDNTEFRELIVQSCEVHLAERYPTQSEKDSFLSHIAATAVKISDHKLFKTAIQSTAIVLDEDVFFIFGEMLQLQSASVEDE